MAVDYSAYRASNAYKNKKSLYDEGMENAKTADEWAAALQGASLGASFGVDAGSKIFGAAAGWTLGLISTLLGNNPNQRQYKTFLKGELENFSSGALTNMEDRNTYTAQLKRTVNATRTNYNDTYGAGKFEEIESAVMGILGMSNPNMLSSVIASLQYDNVAGEMKTRLVSSEYGKGMYEEEDITKLLEAHFSLSDLGAAYTDYIYETYMNADSAIGDAAKQISEEESQGLKAMELGEKELYQQLSGQFMNAFFSQQATDISNATALGSAQSEQSASGIRTSKSTANLSKMQRFRNDLSQATYAATIEYYQAQTRLQLESLEVTRAQLFSRSEANKIALQRQIKQNVNNDINTYLYGVGEGFFNVNDQAKAEGMNVANALAAADKLDMKTSNVQKNYFTATTGTSTK